MEFLTGGRQDGQNITKNKERCKYCNEFLVLFKDGTCKEIYYKDDLINILSKDHIKPIRYIFSMSDRIIVDRDIHINEKEGVLNAII